MSTTIRFELRLEIDVPVEDGDDPRDYVTQQQKTQLEKEVLKALQKKLYGEVVDIEVMDTTIIADEPNPREPGDDDGREYADPRDERDEKELAMSEFGYCPNDHKTPAKPEPERKWLSSGMTPYTADGEVAGYIYDKTPAQQFEAEAVATAQNTVERFQARCATEEAMKDTEQPPLTHIDERPRLTAIADTYEMREAMKLIELLKKDNVAFNNRIEDLEDENDEMRKNASEALETLERVAYVLRTFYFAELSLSTIQPLIALAIEFNPSIVEQRR